MISQAPPQWASASYENGFSYFSWKRKTFLAIIVIACGSGLAAQFPSTTVFQEPVAVSSNSASTDLEETFPSISQPQSRYANNVQVTEKDEEPSFAKPGERIERYTPPPAMNKGSESDVSLPDPQSLSSQKTKGFESIDYTGSERTFLDLSLAQWNPLFDQPPPLSDRLPQPLIDDSVLVPAQSETVQAMKVTMEPFLNTMIDSSQLFPAKEYEIIVIIQEDNLVPANQDFP